MAVWVNIGIGVGRFLFQVQLCGFLPLFSIGITMRIEAKRDTFVLGGPLRNFSKHGAMLIVNAPNEQGLRRRLDADPWMRAGVLRTIDIHPWDILLGKLP